MTKSERIPKAECRKPDLIPAPRSTFGLRISFVICHSSFNRFMVPMHSKNRKRALHEPQSAAGILPVSVYRVGVTDAWPITNRRYGRLKICTVNRYSCRQRNQRKALPTGRRQHVGGSGSWLRRQQRLASRPQLPAKIGRRFQSGFELPPSGNRFLG